jgi:hypothetical protein
MGVRSYSASAGRFSTPDSVLGSTTSPVSFNRFLYADASPVNATDPTGYWPDIKQIRQAIAAGLEQAAAVTRQAQSFLRQGISQGLNTGAQWLTTTQSNGQRFLAELTADPATAIRNLVGGMIFGGAGVVVGMVGGIGYLVQMAGTWLGTVNGLEGVGAGITAAGSVIQTGAKGVGDLFDMAAAQNFDTSSGAYQTGQTFVDVAVVLDGVAGLTKAALRD